MSSPTGAFCAIHPQRPAVATCDHCGTFACPDCVTQHDGDQICATCLEEGRVVLHSVPWQRRDELGIPVAWWRTVMEVTASPGMLFEKMSPTRGVGEAMTFAAISLFPALLTGFIVQTLFLLLFGEICAEWIATVLSEYGGNLDLSPDTMEEIEKVFLVTPGSVTSGLFASVGFGLPIYLFIVAFFATLQHALLMLVGSGKAGFEATLKTAFYSVGIRFWEVIPLVSLITLPWLLVVQGIGFAQIHRASRWQGQIAAWGTLLGCAGCVAGSTAALFVLLTIAGASA